MYRTVETGEQILIINDNLAIIQQCFVCLFVFAGPGEAPSPSGSVLALLESLQNAPHLEVHKDMITWILKVRSDVTVM